jgi:small subunit ribosomal protein S20
VANIKSQIKRNRQNERRHQRNKSVRSGLKTASKKVRTSTAEGDAQATEQLLREATRGLDKAAAKGMVHKRTAARHKSRLAKAARAAQASAEAEAAG